MSSHFYFKVSIFDKYHLFREDLTWDEAVLSCENKGGTLASILSEDEKEQLNEASERETAWIGGRRLEIREESWAWSDGSTWSDIANWYGGYEYYVDSEHYSDDYFNEHNECLKIYREWWMPDRCTSELPYICRFLPKASKADYQLSKDHLGHSISFWMDDLGSSLQGKEMLGFKVNMKANKFERLLQSPAINFVSNFCVLCVIKVDWDIESSLEITNLEAEVGQVGRRLETPGWGQEYSPEWGLEGHVFKASLVMEEAMEVMEEGDTLVIEVAVDAWGGEVSLGRGGPTKSDMLTKKHVLHKEYATWEEAEEVNLTTPTGCYY